MMDKQLDLDAPLLSTRRPESRNPNSLRSSLPFYKSDHKTGPIRDPGVVPFTWEQSPGRPKPAISKTAVNTGSDSNASDDDYEHDFADALDTLSKTESFSMNCSLAGTEFPGNNSSGTFSTDVNVRDFMMERFLPAARAMATESPVARKARDPVRMIERIESGDDSKKKLRFPLSYDEGTSVSYDNEDDGEDGYDDGYDEYYQNGNLFTKGCGLIPKFCFMNPVVPKIEGSSCKWTPPSSVRRVRGTEIKEMSGMVEQAGEEHSWEAVYKHKQIHANPHLSDEYGSKLRSESNHLTYVSDSITADGSSPQFNSNNSGVSTYRNEPSPSSFQEGKAFLGVPKRDRTKSLSNGSHSFSSASPTIDRTLHVDTSTVMKNTTSTNVDSEIETDCIVMQECLVLQTSNYKAMSENNGCKSIGHGDCPLSLKQNNQVKQVMNDSSLALPLLRPPLPNSPSESWLNRTLPSFSSKNVCTQSFSGIQSQQRKQASGQFSVPKEVPVKHPKVQRGPTRFADILAKPLSPPRRSEA